MPISNFARDSISSIRATSLAELADSQLIVENPRILESIQSIQPLASATANFNL